jgi:murein DD-endopeptidase MepM/ murein hydrolase activator NlpD
LPAPFNPAGPEPAPPDWAITMPAAARPGDCLVFSFAPAAGTQSATVTLRAAGGSVLATVPAFDTGTGTLVALIGLDQSTKPGSLTAAATAIRHGIPIASVSSVLVESREFHEEEIAFDAANTAIKTDLGKKRMQEIRALSALLLSRNPESVRFSGIFIPPVKPTRRTALFGDRRTYVYANGERERETHNGIDYGIPTGTPVFASGGGRVVMARTRISTGKTLVIEHFPGVYSLYYHCSSLLAREGEFVKAGEKIALSGATGLATGPHLHHEYRVGGVAVSPDWFTGKKLF